MKKAIAILVTGAVLVGATGGQALAGDREWAVAGKVLAGLLVFDALTSPRSRTTVVYERPVYSPPVAVYPAPVVYHPLVAHRTVVLPPPVRYTVGYPWRRERPHSGSPRDAFRAGFRDGYKAGGHGTRRGRH